MTGAVIVVGAIVVALLATGFLGNKPIVNTGGVSLSAPTYTTPTALADGRALGSKNAPATMDVWSDFQCPACNDFVQTTEPKIISDFVTTGKLRFVYHDYAFLDTRPGVTTKESHDAAAAARCAGDQGKFWTYHDWLFANQGASENSGAFSRTNLIAIADRIGLDQATFTACYDGSAAHAAVDAETTAGTKLVYTGLSGTQATGIDHTPTVLLNGKEVDWSNYSALSALINAAASGSPAPSLGSEAPAPTSAVSPAASASAAP